MSDEMHIGRICMQHLQYLVFKKDYVEHLIHFYIDQVLKSYIDILGQIKLLKLHSPIAFYFFKVATRKFNIKYIACSIFLSVSTELD